VSHRRDSHVTHLPATSRIVSVDLAHELVKWCAARDSNPEPAVIAPGQCRAAL
jgi:hypothetical protein